MTANEVTNGVTTQDSGEEVSRHLDVDLEVTKLMDLEREDLRQELVKLIRQQKILTERVKELEELTDLHCSSAFTIDTVPMEENEDKKQPSIRYSSSTQEVLTIESGQPDEAQSSRVKNNPCWNCEEDTHSMRDCKEPRNPQKISQNRAKFMKNQPISSVRYHIDETQKFGKLKPGLPSMKLRKALGLEDDQLPSYIYRMRELGYPPGWLKEAEISHSNMSLFVSQDETLPDQGDEDGEIADAEDKMQFDTSKLQEWPGFNVDYDTVFRDESDRYRVSPMNPQHGKEAMIEKMSSKEQKGYVRGEMQDTSTKKKDEGNMNSLANCIPKLVLIFFLP